MCCALMECKKLLVGLFLEYRMFTEYCFPLFVDYYPCVCMYHPNNHYLWYHTTTILSLLRCNSPITKFLKKEDLAIKAPAGSAHTIEGKQTTSPFKVMQR